MVVDEVYWFVGSFLGAKAYNFTPIFAKRCSQLVELFPYKAYIYRLAVDICAKID